MSKRKTYFTVTMAVTIKQSDYLGEGSKVAEMSESVRTTVRDFPGVAKVLEQFHTALGAFRSLNVTDDDDE